MLDNNLNTINDPILGDKNIMFLALSNPAIRNTRTLKEYESQIKKYNLMKTIYKEDDKFLKIQKISFLH